MIIASVTKLTRKNARFVRLDEDEVGFQDLKKRLTTTPIFTLPSDSGGFVIFTNASNIRLECVVLREG